MTKVNVHDVLGVKQIGEGEYIGVAPLQKPLKAARGAFGGNLAGQAIIVAMETVVKEFRPHSLHSYFVLPTSDQIPVKWTVEKISQGKNFANRHLRAHQNGRVVYYANVSLTRKNSHGDAQRDYEQYLERIDEQSDDDEDDIEPVVRPLQFQTPYHEWFKRHDISKLKVDDRLSETLVYHKILPELWDLDLTEESEKDLPLTERKFSFLLRWGSPELGVELEGLTKAYHYAGLAVLLDTMFLTRLARVMRIREVDHKDPIHYMSVLLDHVLYFHDDDFDGTDWVGFLCKPLRMLNNRVLFEGEMYNSKGVHVATMIQEGLVMLRNIESYAKI